MTPTEKYQAVREAVIAAVPEIRKLQFRPKKWKNRQAIPSISEARIIEHPIQLADILRALDALPGRTAYAVASDGELLSSGFPHDYDGGDVGEHWNLVYPLDKQPPVVIDFLHSILCKSV